MGFARFMASTTGRVVRVVAGVVLIVGGVLLGGIGGIALALVGVVPLAAGSFDVCIFAPAFSAPFRGADVRSR